MVGWSVFANGLARMNVPENIVRNLQRQSAIREPIGGICPVISFCIHQANVFTVANLHYQLS